MKISDLFRDPRKALLGKLTVYYGVLSLIVWLMTRWVPSIAAYLYSWEDRDRVDYFGDEVFETIGQIAYRALERDAASGLFVSIIGAFVLMIPVTWVYIGTSRRSGLDQSMIESLLMLP